MAEKSTKSTDWQCVAHAKAGDTGMPGSDFRDADCWLERRGDRWRATASMRWGSNQVYLETHGQHYTEGRGDSPSEALDTIREDVLSWACEAITAADLRTMLRACEYAAEDAEV